VSGSVSPRVAGLLAVAGVAVVAGLASGQPELVVLAAPFLLLVGVGLVLAQEPRVVAEI
jgi:predicted tellurium resistance membrane protein TerC